VLRGRTDECEVLDRLLEAVRAGESRALVVRGDAGVGKSALLGYMAGRASGCRVARAAGVQSEMELAYSGLEQLIAPMLDRVDRLPEPQRDALRTAFGLAGGAAPDRFLVGLAVLGLLSDAADEEPLVCLVDDAQWLDQASAQTLAFVARRLVAESVALIFAVREPSDEQILAGLPQLVVNGLGDKDARALLATVIRWPLDERVRDRIVAETHGNPLALLELPQGLTPAQLAGGFGLPSVAALPSHIEDSFTRRLAPLPVASRRLLLLAAAEPLGDSAVLTRAADRLGIKAEATDAAEAAGLVEFCVQVTFRHPLVRSAIYRSASPEQRREAHHALAEATDPQLDADRRAWHFAQAAPGPDEAVAAELERSAERAQARGGLAAAAAFLERSAALTLEPGRRSARALAAARVMAQSGAFSGAERLLATAEAGPLDALQHAWAELLRGQIAFASSAGSDAPPLLLKAAHDFEPLDVGLARQTYLEVLAAGLYGGRFLSDAVLREAATAARAAPVAAQPPSGIDLLMDGLALFITEGYAASVPQLKRAVNAFCGEEISAEALRWLWAVCSTTVRLWDDESWDLLLSRYVRLARETGALGMLPVALNQRAGLFVFQGDFAAAAALVDEAAAIIDVTGSRLPPYSAVILAAYRCRERDLMELVQACTDEVSRRGDGRRPALLDWIMAVFYNSVGRYRDALSAAQRASQDPAELVFSMWGGVELIEASARSGATEQAADALERLSRATNASGGDWALGIQAYARALLSEGEPADHLYREAIERLGHTSIRTSLARGHLVYGEWLRRQQRRSDAREQLRTAHQMFTAMGAEGFAERTRRELLATGETARKRSVENAGSGLTVQETQVAELAREGLSNVEIGARLFISPRTVEYHLGHVFAKLGINSRMQLHRALPANPNGT
jgi:DNA-binding CsgD family transcriptional regulator